MAFRSKTLPRSRGTVVDILVLTVDDGEVIEETGTSFVFDRTGKFEDTLDNE